ncbi:hypothetical protein KKA47_03570 [bacterium]|nr:hypothetical protein [bacterium]
MTITLMVAINVAYCGEWKSFVNMTQLTANGNNGMLIITVYENGINTPYYVLSDNPSKKEIASLCMLAATLGNKLDLYYDIMPNGDHIVHEANLWSKL